MYGIQEIPKGHNPKVFVSSLHAVPQRIYGQGAGSSGAGAGSGAGGAPSSSSNGDGKRRRVNYNIKQIQAEQFNLPGAKAIAEDQEDEMTAVELDISPLELKKAYKRFEELNRENYNDGGKIEIPKALGGRTMHRDSKPSANVKRLLVSRKTWSNYVDEISKSQMKLIHHNGSLVVKPNSMQIKKLCSICGGLSYSSCIKCMSRVCCVKCQKIHDETRCTQF